MSFEGFGGAPDKEKAALPAGLSHAVLVCGGTEEERNKKALYIAKTAVCSGKKDAPCGVCRSCRKADEGVHPDIIIVKRPKDKKFFQKDAIKAVVENAYITPNEADLKVFVIEEMQYMTEECQNVLLKILEEPPSYTSFVLTSSNANAVIKTVLSRVTKIKLSASYEADAFSDKATEIVKNTLSALTKAVSTELECPVIVVDDAYHIAASCAAGEYDDPVYRVAVSHGELALEDCAAISAHCGRKTFSA